MVHNPVFWLALGTVLLALIGAVVNALKDSKYKKIYAIIITFLSALVACFVAVIGLQKDEEKDAKDQQKDVVEKSHYHDEVGYRRTTLKNDSAAQAKAREILDHVEDVENSLSTKPKQVASLTVIHDNNREILNNQLREQYKIERFGISYSVTYYVKDNPFLAGYIARLRKQYYATEQANGGTHKEVATINQFKADGIAVNPIEVVPNESPRRYRYVLTITDEADKEWFPNPKTEQDAHELLNRALLYVEISKSNPRVGKHPQSRSYHVAAVNPSVAPLVPLEKHDSPKGNSRFELLVSHDDTYITQSVSTDCSVIADNEKYFASMVDLPGASIAISAENVFPYSRPALSTLRLYFGADMTLQVEPPLSAITSFLPTDKNNQWVLWRYTFTKADLPTL